MSDTAPVQPPPDAEKDARIAQWRQLNPDAIFATDSRGRVFTIETLGPAAMLNVIEMAGGAAADNSVWLRMAMMLSGVTAIDGMPLPKPKTKAAFLVFADKIGNDGLIAISGAINGPATSEDTSTEDDAPSAAAATREAELAASRSS